jgi:N-acetylneuraminic acid mutarotase/glucose/arabinose dehydrogenase
LLLAATAAAQATVFGAGCPGLGPEPQISFSGFTTPGLTGAVHLAGGPANGFAMAIIGTSAPPPIDLSGVAGVNPGCELLVSNQVLLLLPTDGNGDIKFAFKMPVGLGPDLYVQWAVFEEVEPLSITLSAGLHIVLTQVATVTPGSLDFGAVESDGPAAVLPVSLTNDTDQPITLTGAIVFDRDAAEFDVAFQADPPVVLAPTQSVVLDVTYDPFDMGLSEAVVEVQQAALPGSFSNPLLPVSGVGLGPKGADLLVNCGGDDYFDSQQQLWSRDFGSTDGQPESTANPVAGTDDPALYQDYRSGASVIRYDLPVPNATYDVVMHFTEPEVTAANRRVFDVLLEGQLALDDVDIFAAAGKDVAHALPATTTVENGHLDIELIASKNFSLVSAIEVRRRFPILVPDVPSVDFGAVALLTTSQTTLTLTNDGNETATLDAVGFLVGPGGGSGDQFELDIEGDLYTGATTDVTVPIVPAVTIEPRASVAIPLTFAPTASDQENDVVLSFEGDFDAATVNVLGFGAPQGDTFLHVVIEDPGLLVDYDGDGFETVLLDGSFSHTHEPGHELAGYTWTEGETVLGTTPVIAPVLATGPHGVCLEIADDKLPPETLSDCIGLEVHDRSRIPGVIAYYHRPLAGQTPEDLLDSVPAHADWAETLSVLRVEDTGAVGGSPFSENVMVVLEAGVDVAAADEYAFAATGGVDQRLFVDGQAGGGPWSLSVGQHSVEARFAVAQVAELPLEVTLAQGGGMQLPIVAADLTYDISGEKPVINEMPTAGITLGGNDIVIKGFGFFPSDQTTVHWGNEDLLLRDFQAISATEIRFDSPPSAPATILVSVETPQGVSNVRTYTYNENTTPPIEFDISTPVTGLGLPTCGAWGPDGRFYVFDRFGTLSAVTFDEHYDVVQLDTYPGVGGHPSNETLGIAFNPFEPADPVRIYVAHARLFAQGGGFFRGLAPYPGFVSVLTGPDFDAPVEVITGLPTSNHDHGVNGMVFDHNGDLLIAMGGNTNAGVQSEKMGDLPESPLSGAILKARLSKPGFNGSIAYEEIVPGTVPDPMDQVYGGGVVVAAGVDVAVHAPGLRNPYDLVLHTNRRLYATDNGPNTTFGPASTGPDTQSPDPTGPDEVVLVEAGNYYGAANRTRGTFDPRQNVYRGAATASIPGEYVAPLLTVSSSSDGITEYRATTFQSQMRDDLLVQRWNGALKRIALSADGRSALGSLDIKTTNALDVETGPGGAIVVVQYSPGGRIRVLEPDDPTATSMTAYDIFPWRARASSGDAFVIGGVNFGTLADTTVTIGGLPATVTEVTPLRIKGTLPTNPTPTTDLLDVVVTSDSRQSSIPDGFRYLFDAPGLEPGWWEVGNDLPVELGEVACGVIAGKLYIVGDDDAGTYALDLETGAWSAGLDVRDFPGDHHGAEVVDGKLYLFGGIGAGSQGRVQIYDPVADSWSAGADMPLLAGSANTALIDGLVYACGGIVSGATVDDHHAYDPQTDTWGPALAPMPVGRNHAAAATDGGKLFVFGGRTGPNQVSNGFDDVQVYDPATDSWTWDKDGVSGLAPLPIGRGGTGKAVYYQGEFYVFGGETLDGPGAKPQGVYDRVDVYDPATNTWRLEAPMPTARHGIFPVLHQSRIWVAGGGTNAGHSHSEIVEVFTRQ